MTDSAFTIRLAHWPKDKDALKQVREAVFVREQRVPVELARKFHRPTGNRPLFVA